MAYHYEPFDDVHEHYSFVLAEFRKLDRHHVDNWGFDMSTAEGNRLMWSMIYVVVQMLLKHEDRESVVNYLKYQWALIQSIYREAYDTDVKEHVWYYIDPIFEKLKYEKLSIPELYEDNI